MFSSTVKIFDITINISLSFNEAVFSHKFKYVLLVVYKYKHNRI